MLKTTFLGALALVLAAGGLASADAPRRAKGAGVLEAEITLGPELPGRRMSFNLYPDLRRKSAPAAETDDEMHNVVVYLENLELQAPKAPAASFVMSQQDGAFVPHVLPVPVGSTVEFPNADEIYHNVFSLSRSYSFDLGRYPRGVSRSVRFDEPGVVKVFCHIHSDMSGVVLVLPTSYFARPDEHGRLRIEGIPPGEYTVVAWHERAPRTTRTVRIAADEATRVEFVIPLAEQPESGS